MASVADQIKKLQDEARKIDEEAEAKKAANAEKLAKLRDSAIEEVMLDGKAVVQRLKDLNMSVFDIGTLFAAQLGLPIGKGSKGSPLKHAKSSGVTRTPNTERPCPVCDFRTIPHHDGRLHKKHPEAFTAAELKERGMEKVG